MRQFLLNGLESDSLPLADRAVQYGDGLFETIAVRDGRIEFWQRHMKRLSDGCQRLKIPQPDHSLLLAEAKQLVAKRDGILKITISRGQGGRGYRPPSDAEPSRVLGFYPLPAYPVEYARQGVVLTVCETLLGLNPQLAGMKHLNRLEQVMGRSEWSDDSIAEGLMLDIHGNVIEGTMSNLFMVRNGELHTPEIDNCGISGVMRQVVLVCAEALGIKVTRGRYTLASLFNADALFVTNSVIGIWPVRQLQSHSYQVDALTQQLQNAIATLSTQRGEYEPAH